MELWIFAFIHIVSQWNNIPRFDLDYQTPDERLHDLRHQFRTKDYFKAFHPFGCPVYALNNILQGGKGQPKL